MAETPAEDPTLDEEYDEEADSDFNEPGSNGSDISASSDEDERDGPKTELGRKKSTVKEPEGPYISLDSGDEATIGQQKPSKKRTKDKAEKTDSVDADESSEEWRAKTRSMKAQEKEERRQKKLANLKTSTIDVNQVWEQMNKPGPLPPLRIEGETENDDPAPKDGEVTLQPTALPEKNQDMITIKRQYKFAGEIHTEEKTVHKSSAEAQLWLAQQQGRPKSPSADDTGRQRPVRKVSRFDPNFSNMAAFKNQALMAANQEAFKGPRLNVVEKSKMDWASHVDAEGLKDELDKHAKTKEAYLSRMDFLGEVDQRREDEAREARLRG